MTKDSQRGMTLPDGLPVVWCWGAHGENELRGQQEMISPEQPPAITEYRTGLLPEHRWRSRQPGSPIR